jgi:hypothetical protein
MGGSKNKSPAQKQKSQSKDVDQKSLKNLKRVMQQRLLLQ